LKGNFEAGKEKKRGGREGGNKKKRAVVKV